MTKKTTNPVWKKTLLSSAIAIASATSSVGVRATCATNINSSVGPCSVTASGQTITVTSAGSVEATSGTSAIDISGAGLDVDIINNGTISSFDETSSATAYGIYASDTFTGSIENSGTISAEAIATSWEAEAYGIYIDGDLDGNINNSGTISAQATGITSATVYGIYVIGNVEGDITNSGTISALAIDEESEAEAYGIYMTGALEGSINNSGTISAQATGITSATVYGIYVGGNLEGAITNSGTISALAIDNDSSAEAYGIYVSGNMNGSISNTGTIDAEAENTGDGSAYAYGIYVSGTTNGSITNDGTINAYAHTESTSADSYITAWGMYLSDIGTTGTVTNNGTITVRAHNANVSDSEAWAFGIKAGTVNGSINNTGTINALATQDGTSSASAYGIDVGTISSTGSVSNSGTINVIATQNLSDYAYAYGIQTDTVDGSVSNSGTLNVFANVTHESGDYASAWGMDLGSIGATGSVNNSGSIIVRARSVGDYVQAFGIEADTVSGSLTNAGSIKVSAETLGSGWGSAYGIEFSSIALGGSVTNTGDITSTFRGFNTGGSAYGISTSTINGSLNNSGAIVASAESFDDTAYAYGINTGAIAGSATGGSLTNSGILNVSAQSSDYAAYAYGINVSGSISGSAVNERGVLNNSATINVSAVGDSYWASAYGIIVSSGVSQFGTLTNSGDITVYTDGGDTGGTARGISTSSVAGIFTNSGNINATAVGDDYFVQAYGIQVGDLSTSTVDTVIENSGNITLMASIDHGSASYPSALGIYATGIMNGSFSNSGNITATSTHEGSGSAYAWGLYFSGFGNGTDAASFTNSGNIVLDVSAGGENAKFIDNNSFYASAIGIRTGNFGANSTFTNSGSITVSATHNDQNTDNSGSSAYATGIQAGSFSGDGMFTNTGDITAMAESLFGDHDAYAYGMSLSSFNGNAEFSNTASIDVMAKAHGSGSASVSGIDIGSLGTQAQVINSGNITATAEGNDWVAAYGISVDTLNADGTDGAIFANSGAITATATSTDDAEAFGLYLSSIEAILTATNTGSASNSGTIIATANAGDDATAVGIAIDYIDADGGFTNSGSVTAIANGGDRERAYAVWVDGGSGTFTNTGSLNGAVYTTGDFVNSGTHTLQLGDTAKFSPSIIGGTADYTGATLAVDVAKDTQLKNGDVFNDVITAGTFTSNDSINNIVDNRVLFDFSAVVENNAVDITVSRQAITDAVGGMYNGAGTVLENLYQSGEAQGDMLALLQNVNSAETLDELKSVINASANPALGGQTGFVTTQQLNTISQVINDRIASQRGMAAGEGSGNDKLWTRLTLNDGERDSTSGAAGYEVKSTTLVLGVDYQKESGKSKGVALALTNGDVEGDLGMADVSMEAIQISAYADWNRDNGDFITTQVSLSLGDNDVDGAESFDSTGLNLNAGYGRHYKRNDRLTLTPVASVSYTRIMEDSYDIGLINVDQNDYDSLELGVDGHLAYKLDTAKDIALTANLGLGFDVLGDETEASASFVGGPGFTAKADQDDMSVKLGVGINVAHSDTISYSFSYDMLDRGDFTNNALTANVSKKF